MNNKLTSTKATNIYAFLKVVPNLKTLSQQSIIKLSERFTISPESFALLVSIAINGGIYFVAKDFNSFYEWYIQLI